MQLHLAVRKLPPNNTFTVLCKGQHQLCFSKERGKESHVFQVNMGLAGNVIDYISHIFLLLASYEILL